MPDSILREALRLLFLLKRARPSVVGRDNWQSDARFAASAWRALCCESNATDSKGHTADIAQALERPNDLLTDVEVWSKKAWKSSG